MGVYREDILNVELESGSINRSFLNHTIGMADNGANRFGVRIFRGGAPVGLAGVSCQGFFRDSHGNNILVNNGETRNNEAYITLPQACYNYEGQFTLAIKLIGDGVTGTMRIVDGVVDNTNTDSPIAPTDAVPTYAEIIALYEEMLEATEAAEEMIGMQAVIGPKNECAVNQAEDSTFIRSQDGAIRRGGEYSEWRAVTTPIPVTPGYTIEHDNCNVFFYGSDDSYIDCGIETGNTEVPAGTAYMLLCWKIADDAKAIIRDGNGNAEILFDGRQATFVPESIPESAVKNMSGAAQVARNRDVTEGKWVEGKYLRGQDGGIRDNAEHKATAEYTDVTGWTHFYSIGCEVVCFYDAGTEFVASEYENGKWIAIPSGAKYVRFSAGISDTAYAYGKTAEGVLAIFAPGENVAFKNRCIPFSAVDAEGVPATLPPDVKLIAPTGGDYDNIGEANARCDGSYAMMILPGTYAGGWHAADDTYGNKRERKVYVGLARDDCVCVREGTAYGEDVFHTNGNSYMQNLSLKALKATGASTCGYALHLDNGWLANRTIVFEGCYFSSEGRAAAGIGTRPNCHIIFRNCVFETDYNGNGAVFFHNNPTVDEGGNQRLTFINCEIHSKSGVALYVEEIGGDNNDIQLTMIGCTLWSDTLGVTNILSIDKTSYTGSGNGNVKLTPWSHGNNIDLTNVFN